MVERDRAYGAIRGVAEIDSKDFSFDAVVAARSPHDLRVEVSGPLGVKIGLLVMNKKWIQFFIPKKRLLMRLPVSELEKNSIRAERFLRSVVLPLPPKQLIAAISTRSLLAEGGKVLECKYLDEENAYRVAIADPSKQGGQLIDFDPTSFAPLLLRSYDSLRPRLNFENADRYSHKIVFSRLMGEGMAIMPRQVVLESRSSKHKTVLEWDQVEVWNEPVDTAFDVVRNASIAVKDY